MIHGPYSFAPPVFWYEEGEKHFNTEVGPGTCIPVAESLRRFLPADQQHVGSEAWRFHCGLQIFTHTCDTDKALKKRYGVGTEDFERYVEASQVMGYELWRAMYEAWARNWSAASGAMGWMLNSAWPSMIWQMIDYYNIPVGAFYGVQKACEPLHSQYSYDDASAWVINLTNEALNGVTLRATTYAPDARLLSEQTSVLSLRPHDRKKAFVVAMPEKVSGLFFLRLTLEQERRALTRNTYWLSTQMDAVERTNKSYDASHFKAQNSFADLSALRDLSPAEIDFETQITRRRSRVVLTTHIANPSDRIAFFLRAQVRSRATGQLVGPVTWNENCVTLLPGEHTKLVGSTPQVKPFRDDLSVEVTGWNIGH